MKESFQSNFVLIWRRLLELSSNLNPLWASIYILRIQYPKLYDEIQNFQYFDMFRV